jgi:16S rRNA (cytosine967-C5)-methyltransferase
VKNFTLPVFPEEVAVECPERFEEALRALFGKEFFPEMQAMLEPATLDLRVNTSRAPLEKVQKFLEADGVVTEKTPYSPWGLRCERKAYLSRTKAMAKGWIDIQDEGSQLIALVCGAEPGMQILDYCAGAGGKTLALASAMQNKGRIVAMDLETRRLEKSRQRFKKAGVSDMIEVRPLEVDKNRKWLRRQKGTFDIVLCDVPCSGTGTWRRNPDMRWRTYGPDVKDLIPIQSEILMRIAHTIKPGGRLVYATCSMLPEENEARIQEFLEQNPDFYLRPVREILPQIPQWEDGKFMRLSPYRCATDGFFAAVLERKGIS